MRSRFLSNVGWGLLGVFLIACQPRQFVGTLLDPAKPIDDFTVAATNGGEFHLSDQPSPLLVLFFGYTHCPDVCPTTLYELDQAMALLGGDASSVQVAMVTVDPERDTPEILNAYVQNFNPSFMGLREPDTDKLAAIIAEFGVFYEIQDHPEGSEDYLVSHTPSLIVLDQSGMRLVIPGGTSAEDIAADLRALLKLGSIRRAGLTPARFRFPFYGPAVASSVAVGV